MRPSKPELSAQNGRKILCAWFSLFFIGSFYFSLIYWLFNHDFVVEYWFIPFIIIFIPLPLTVWALWSGTNKPSCSDAVRSVLHFVLALSIVHTALAVAIVLFLLQSCE